MKTLPIFLSLSIIMFACRPAKKIQKTESPVSIIDTVSVAVTPHNHPENNKKEVATIPKDIFDKVLKKRVDFTTFNAKMRVQYQSKEGEDDATAFIRMKKDSTIWVSFRGPLGIEGFRVLITKDSVKVLDLLKKSVQYRTIAFIEEMTGIPFDFITLQDLFVGNPVFVDSNITSYKVNPNNELLVAMEGKVFKHLLSIDNTDSKILHSKFESVGAGKSRNCDIAFTKYENNTGFLFSTERKISLVDQSILTVNLDFKQYAFNQPLTFPFNIPKNYKKL